jgi:hypothetical protein
MQIQDVVLSGIRDVQRITHDTLREQPTPGAATEYRRILGSEGREYNLSLNIDRQRFDELNAAADDNRVVWCQDETEGSFHAIMELTGFQSVYDASVISVQLNLLARDSVFAPDKFNPKVFA